MTSKALGKKLEQLGTSFQKLCIASNAILLAEERKKHGHREKCPRKKDSLEVFLLHAVWQDRIILIVMNMMMMMVMMMMKNE